MSTITSFIETSSSRYIDEHWIKSDQANFIKKKLLSRIAHFGLVFFAILARTKDTIIGVEAGILSLLTFGHNKNICQMAMNQLSRAQSIISDPYYHLLKSINPTAECNRLNDNLSTLVHKPLTSVARYCYQSEGFFKHHIASRGAYTLLALSSLVSRTVDGIIGIIAATFSLIPSLAEHEPMNSIAYNYLKAPGIIQDLFFSIIGMINPETANFLLKEGNYV